MSETTTETATPPVENVNTTVSGDATAESTHETRIQWLEKEVRKLLHLPEDAPLED